MDFTFELASDSDFVKALLELSPLFENCGRVYISYLVHHFYK